MSPQIHLTLYKAAGSPAEGLGPTSQKQEGWNGEQGGLGHPTLR